MLSCKLLVQMCHSNQTVVKYTKNFLQIKIMAGCLRHVMPVWHVNCICIINVLSLSGGQIKYLAQIHGSLDVILSLKLINFEHETLNVKFSDDAAHLTWPSRCVRYMRKVKSKLQ